MIKKKSKKFVQIFHSFAVKISKYRYINFKIGINPYIFIQSSTYKDENSLKTTKTN